MSVLLNYCHYSHWSVSCPHLWSFSWIAQNTAKHSTNKKEKQVSPISVDRIVCVPSNCDKEPESEHRYRDRAKGSVLNSSRLLGSVCGSWRAKLFATYLNVKRYRGSTPERGAWSSQERCAANSSKIGRSDPERSFP